MSAVKEKRWEEGGLDPRMLHACMICTNYCTQNGICKKKFHTTFSIDTLNTWGNAITL